MLGAPTAKKALLAILVAISFPTCLVAGSQAFHIPAGRLIAALESLAKQANVDLVYQDEQVKRFMTSGVTGDFSPHDAVVKLLEGLPLQVHTDEVSGALLITVSSTTSGTSSTTGEGAMDTSKKGRGSARLLGAIGAILAGSAGTGAHAAQPGVNAVEEVLVTARRREESLQEVPIAISAFGGENLEQRGIERVENMNAVAPNLSVAGGVNTGESTASFRVRGVPGVSVYIDGVNQAQTDGLLTMGVVEVDRIEVLRGPQGTLFGSSSLGGAVSYVTRAPADTFGARVRGSIGTYNRRDIQGAIDLPLSDTFKTKFTAASQTRDGYMRSRISNFAYGDINDELFRADFLWKPLDALSVRYNYEVSNTDRKGPARLSAELEPHFTLTLPGGRTVNNYPQGRIYQNLGIAYNPASEVSGYPGGQVGEWETNVGWAGDGIIINQDRHTLDVNWNINEKFRVRSITGSKELYRYTQTDLDGDSRVVILDRETGGKNYTFSQELQVLGSHERFDWVLGAFYQHEYNRARTNTRVFAEMTCDMWAAEDQTRRGITPQDRASCYNRRATALGLTSQATATAASTPAASVLANFFNPTAPGNSVASVNALLAANGGIDLSQFSAAVQSTNDNLTINPAIDSKAVFGDITWRATDKLTIAAGLRYTKDESDGSLQVGIQSGAENRRGFLANHAGQFLDGTTQNFLGFVGPLPAVLNPTSFSALTKRLTVQYQWNPDLMTYLGYADGYGPGGVAQLGTPSLINYLSQVQSDVPLTITRDKQTINNYEFGVRADWAGGVFRTNLTVFYTDWKNIPVSQYLATMWWDTDGNGLADRQVDITGDGVNDPFYFPNLFGTSVAKAEAKGIELEAIWRATDALRFDFNAGYLKTKYKELGAAGTGVVPAVRLGAPFAGAPEFTSNLSGQYVFEFAGGSALTPRIDYTYTDDYTLTSGVENQRIQKGFGMLNARLTYDSGANWSVNLLGTNLTNEWYFNSGFYTRADRVNFVTVGRPREFGLTFDFKFQ